MIRAVWAILLALVGLAFGPVGPVGADTAAADQIAPRSMASAYTGELTTPVGPVATTVLCSAPPSGTADRRSRAAYPVSAESDEVAVAANTAARACSFAGTTTVLMADGTRKPIQDVKVGDEVIATDPETGEQVAKRVEHVFVHADTVVDLVVDGEVVTTTKDHPFWSVTDQRFERADELSPGEEVLAADGRVITVSGLKLGTAREALAYNLGVEGIHTYHVGNADVLVHNTCIPWSSASLGNVAGDLASGARTANVANRSQAEELFLRMYQGNGYTNTTGMSGKQVRDFYGSKAGTYHWDTELTPGLTHSTGPHLQIHQPDGVIVRIFYGGAP